MGRRPNHSVISGDPAANDMIKRLHGSIRIILALRKSKNSLKMRIDAATCLVWKSCYDLGLVYIFGSDEKWSTICKCIRSLIRSAGLDQMSHNTDVYKISTKLTPEHMAFKQILQLGLKSIDCEAIADTRYQM